MIKLVKTDRKPNLTGVTPGWIIGVALFIATVLVGHYAGRHFGADLVPCLFKLVTGEPCVLCGGTRASLCLARGDFPGAFTYNPLVTIVLSGAVFLLILKFGFARKLQVTAPLMIRRVLWILLIIAVIINWIYVMRTL
jgi:Protein of unknown function (DUF2752)